MLKFVDSWCLPCGNIFLPKSILVLTQLVASGHLFQENMGLLFVSVAILNVHFGADA